MPFLDRPSRAALVACLVLAAGLGCIGARTEDTDSGRAQAEPRSEAAEHGLRFRRGDETVGHLTLAEIAGLCAIERVEVADPYYERPMRFLACPLVPLLERGFGETAGRLEARHFFLRARDGYTRPADGAQLVQSGGWIALADASLVPDAATLRSLAGVDGAPRFAPIDRRQVDPAPYYMIWSEAGQQDPHHWPWPYQLVEVQIAPFASRFPHMEPRGEAPGSAPMRGYALFRRQCVSCHSINGDGGKVGPELNVPQSIVEYRPAEQIRAYIRNPAAFRYTTMPAHPGLSERDLDDLVAYFRAMSVRKRDPHEG